MTPAVALQHRDSGIAVFQSPFCFREYVWTPAGCRTSAVGAGSSSSGWHCPLQDTQQAEDPPTPQQLAKISWDQSGKAGRIPAELEMAELEERHLFEL